MIRLLGFGASFTSSARRLSSRSALSIGRVRTPTLFARHASQLPTRAPENLVQTVHIVRKALSSHSIDAALHDFYRELQRPENRPNIRAWNVIIDLCAKNDRVREADRLYKTMLSRNVIPNVLTFMALINGHGRSGNILEAMKYYKEMLERKLRPNMHIFSSLMTIHIRCGNYSQAATVFENIRAQGLIPNSVCFNAMLHAISLSGALPHALRLWDEMNTRGLEISTYTFSSLITCAFKSGHRSAGMYLLELMREREIPINEAIYYSVLQGTCGMNEVEHVLSNMAANGIKRSRASYVAAFLSLSKSHNMNAIRNLYARMIRDNVSPDAPLLGMLSGIAAANGDLLLVDFLFDEADKRGLVHDPRLYTKFLGHRRTGLTEVSACIKRMQRHQVVPPREIGDKIVMLLTNQGASVDSIAEIQRHLRALGMPDEPTESAASSQVERARANASFL